MAYLGMSFDANTVEPSDRSALPAGDYTVMITASEWKDSKAGAQYLALTLQVVDGPHKGRFLWDTLNLNHPKQYVLAIAQQTLSAICRATGHMAISDSEELHNIPVVVRVAYIEAKNGFDEKNQIKQWKPAGSAASPVAPAAHPAHPKAPPVAAAKAVPPVPRTPAKAPPAPAGPVAGKPWLKNQTPPVAEVAGDINDDVPF